MTAGQPNATHSAAAPTRHADGWATGMADRLAIARTDLFTGLVIIAFANGITENIAQAIGEKGFALALFGTFGISIFVWAALFFGINLLRRAPPARASALDLIVAVGAIAAILIPIPSLSWLAIGAIALWLMARSSGHDLSRRAGAILLAMTVPMLWSRILMSAFGEAVLAVDASLVAWLVGTERNGNVVPFADGSGAMFIAPGCSSLSNVALAILCSVIFINATDSRWSGGKLAVALCACIAVIVINVVRIGLIGFYPSQFDLIHGDVGANIAGFLETAAILVICYFGMRRHAPRAA